MHIPQTKTELIDLVLESEFLEALPSGNLITELKTQLSLDQFVIALTFISNSLIKDISQYLSQILDIEALKELEASLEKYDKQAIQAFISQLYIKSTDFQNLIDRSIKLSTKLSLNE